MKQRLYRFLEPATGRTSRAKQCFDVLIPALILLSVGAVILRTHPGIAADYGWYLQALQWVATVVFTVEYLLRLYACTADPRFAHPLRGRVRFALTPMAAVDLLSVLPFYLVTFLAPGSELAGAMLMLRMLRLLKLFRYSRSLAVFTWVLKDKADQLLAGLLMTGLLLIVSSSLVYFAEREAQPGVFHSIPETMWWGIITLTTVGYGDMSPVTPLGQLFGAFTALVGIGLVALPSGILASGFIEGFAEAQRQDEHDRSDEVPADASSLADTLTCPHCEQPIEGVVAAGSRR
jgi:voltage-gated potassium channel